MGHVTAVYKRSAGYPGRFVRSKRQDCICNICRLTNPADGVQSQDFIFLFFYNFSVVVYPHPARADCVDSDFVLSEIKSHTFAEQFHTSLCCIVSAHLTLADVS